LTTSYFVSTDDFIILLLLNSYLIFREINSLPLNPTAELGLILYNLTNNSFYSFLTIVYVDDYGLFFNYLWTECISSNVSSVMILGIYGLMT
jgi:hypothetical protein